MPLGAAGGSTSGAVRAGRAFVEFFGKDRLTPLLASLKDRLGSFGGEVAKVGGGLAAAVGGPLALGGKFALDSIFDLSRQGAIADALGLTAEQFTGIAGVAKSAGEDTREFIESLVTLGKVASEGALGKGEVAGQFFKDINVNAKEFASLAPDEQFFQLFEAVQKVEDPLKRVRSLMVAFGEDGGKFLLPLLSKAPDELRDLAASFAASGDEIRSAREAQEAYSKATATLDKVWRSVVVTVAPAVAQIADAVTELAGPVAEWVRGNKEIVLAGVAAAAGLAGLGVALLAVGGGLSAAASAAGPILGVLGLFTTSLPAIVSGIAGLISSVVGFAATNAVWVGIAAAVAGVGSALLGTTETGRDLTARLGGYLEGLAQTARDGLGQALDWVAGRFAATRDTAVSAWQGVGAALRGNDFAGAGRVAVAAIGVEWARVGADATAVWNGFKGTVLDAFIAVQDRGELTWLAVRTGAGVAADVIAQAWADAGEKLAPIKDAWVGIVGFLRSTFGGFVEWFGKQLAGVLEFVSRNAGAILAAVSPSTAIALEAAAETLKNLGSGLKAGGEDFGAAFDARIADAEAKLKAAQEQARRAREEGREAEQAAADQRAKDAEAAFAEIQAEQARLEAIRQAQEGAVAAAGAVADLLGGPGRGGPSVPGGTVAAAAKLAFSTNGRAAQIFGGGSSSPIVNAVREQVKETKALKEKLVDIYDAIRDQDDARFA